ncbi:beta-carotene isomerase D27, chloroplastic-like isoform X4 [Coffea arabica]|uniref:Beta-carotene isomerase D27, chloroplastic-like isoform X4 n=1 Tax=Coffea arabica TaxID=13443 RepID=A0A6P6VF37_COFAR|nr:beta-carotene isomerase D27, chloroplastic-like isoform X4 [Coffea arabica]XP_027101564.1 beta-carotene isomerase D27, chloroplastic-like isoform X4 [Coffea arabica]
MVVLTSFQAVQVHNQAAAIKCGYHPRLRLKNGTVSIRCGIAEPSGEPAPVGQKTKYKDGFFEKAFMTLFARKMEKFAAKSNKDGTPVEKKGWFDYDYESFVDVSKRVIQGRNRTQQQQVVREVLLSMLPPGAPAQVVEVEVNGVKQRSGVRIKKCRYLENSGCVGMCVNMCKIPTQDFFTDEFGLPLTMTPNFEDMSCEMVYGQAPPPFEDDPASKQPCFADICKHQLLKALWQIPIRASVPSCKPNRNSSYFFSGKCFFSQGAVTMARHSKVTEKDQTRRNCLFEL